VLNHGFTTGDEDLSELVGIFLSRVICCQIGDLMAPKKEKTGYRLGARLAY
jgi:hypothetical protein